MQYFVCYNMGCCGIGAGAATNCTMNRNLIHDAGVYVCGDYDGDDPPQEGEGGMMSICLRDGEIAYNEVYDIYRQGTPYDAMGIDVDWNCTNNGKTLRVGQSFFVRRSIYFTNMIGPIQRNF